MKKFAYLTAWNHALVVAIGEPHRRHFVSAIDVNQTAALETSWSNFSNAHPTDLYADVGSFFEVLRQIT